MGKLYSISRRDVPALDALDNGDDGGNFGGMEARIVRLETLAEVTEKTLADIKGDVREIRKDTKDIRKELSAAKVWALILLGTGWISLVGVMAKGFGWTK